MHDSTDPAAPPPDAITTNLDRDGLKDAHGRTGRMLQNAGLPFEEDEFDEDSSSDSDSSWSSDSELDHSQ